MLQLFCVYFWRAYRCSVFESDVSTTSLSISRSRSETQFNATGDDLIITVLADELVPVSGSIDITPSNFPPFPGPQWVLDPPSGFLLRESSSDSGDSLRYLILLEPLCTLSPAKQNQRDQNSATSSKL